MFAEVGLPDWRRYVLLKSAYPNARKIVPRVNCAMTIFYTSGASLNETISVNGKPLEVNGKIYELPETAKNILLEKYIPDDMPFILNTDGSYKTKINEFLLSLAMTCESPVTWRGYAYNIRQFEQFLLSETECDGLLSAGPEELNLYFRKRRTYEPNSDEEIKTVKRTTWSRDIAAIGRFSEWRSANCSEPQPLYTRKSSPKGRYQRHILRGGHSTVSTRSAIKSISMSDYVAFRDIGLAEMGAGKGRTNARNIALSELLITTGMRISECSALLLHELPNPERNDRFLSRHLRLQLATKITKGQKSREILVPKRVLRDQLRRYIEIDRAASIERAVRRGLYSDLNHIIHTSNEEIDRCRIRNKEVNYDHLSIAKRKIMYSVDDRGYPLLPSMLWLRDYGLPLDAGCFNVIFSRARKVLLQRSGRRIDVSPHTLRHTFAIYRLTQLIEATCENIENLRRERSTSSPGAYGRLIADPLAELQRQLGHSSQETTRIYLTYVEQASDIIDHEIRTWVDNDPIAG